jgi:BarA-like signal transduction histidine kinase
MATINTNAAKAAIVVQLLMTSGVRFIYERKVGQGAQHCESIMVCDSRAELLRECLEIAGERLKREAGIASTVHRQNLLAEFEPVPTVGTQSYHGGYEHGRGDQ